MTIPAALGGQRLAVVDVEGNGRQPPQIVEIAVLAVHEVMSVDDVQTWLVRPDEAITGLVTRKVHGISNADVAEAPRWAEIAADIARLLTGRTLVAHNASVEHRVLAAHLPDWRPGMVLDTLRLAKHVWPGLPSYSLDRLITHAALDHSDAPGQHHRAGWDAWMTGQLLITLTEHGQLDWPGLLTAAALPGLGQPEPDAGLW